ncbi:MAG: hypothetical protein ACRDK4_04950 [Solirubrobacteraceae bacterium]
MFGFSFSYRMSGGAPTIQSLKFHKEETLTVGDIVFENGGGAELAATNGSKYLGPVLETKAGKTTDTIEVIVDSDAVYEVEDKNARKIGDTLDLTGTTGKQGIAASLHKEFVVVAESSASEPTLVRFNTGKHLYNTAQ